MILCASNRTDIVAFYLPWFLNRYEKGYVDVRNPFYPKNVSRIYFSDVDAILFCTKNPIHLVKQIHKLKKPIILQVTITPYKLDIEPCVLSKEKVIESLIELSKVIDKEYIYLRYDPIIINEKYNIKYHERAFKKLCEQLKGHIKHVIISFVDNYKNVENHQSSLNNKELTFNEMCEVAKILHKIASENEMTIQTCAEENKFLEHGFLNQPCISRDMVRMLTGKTSFKGGKHRKHCHCVEVADIGVYNSCKHYCHYCYANYDELKVQNNYLHHDRNSSLLVGHLKETDVIKIRK